MLNNHLVNHSSLIHHRLVGCLHVHCRCWCPTYPCFQVEGTAVWSCGKIRNGAVVLSSAHEEKLLGTGRPRGYTAEGLRLMKVFSLWRQLVGGEDCRICFLCRHSWERTRGLPRYVCRSSCYWQSPAWRKSSRCMHFDWKQTYDHRPYCHWCFRQVRTRCILTSTGRSSRQSSAVVLSRRCHSGQTT